MNNQIVAASAAEDSHVPSFTMWKNLIHQNFYAGELSSWHEGTSVQVKAGFLYPVKVTRISSNMPVSFRRGLEHVREDGSGVIAIAFVLRGECKVTRSRGSYDVLPGHFIIKDSNVPFRSSMIPRDGIFDCIYFVVPRHLYISHVYGGKNIDEPIAFDGNCSGTLGKMVDLYSEAWTAVGERTSEALACAFMAALAEHLDLATRGAEREDGATIKISEIKSKISQYLTDPRLSHEKIAKECGMSSRNLYYLLKKEGVTFSKLVWCNRLEKAREWLTSHDLRHSTVKQISYLAGFKNPAHFSRAFKEAYGVSPIAYRVKRDLEVTMDGAEKVSAS